MPNKNINKTELTERVLLSLMFELGVLCNSIERVKVQIVALAKEHGIDHAIHMG